MSGSRRAFTLVELLVVVAILGVLASLLLPGLAGAKDKARAVGCSSNLRNLQLAANLYAGENDGRFAPERRSPNWVEVYARRLASTNVIRCPSESVIEPSTVDARSSYIANGFNEVVAAGLGNPKVVPPPALLNSTYSLKESEVRLPSKTIFFGEKSSLSKDYYVNLILDGSRFIENLEEERHKAGPSLESRGSSNYSFCDGSVVRLGFGKSTCPLNLWALDEPLRSDAAICRPRH